MEATEKVEGPDLSGPQGPPSAGNHQLGGDLGGSQGPWISSGSLYFRHGLSFSPLGIIEGDCGRVPQAHIPEPSHQDLPHDNTSWGLEQVSQDAPRFIPHGPPRPIERPLPHLIMEDGSLTLPVCTRNDCSHVGDITQPGPCSSPFLHLQVRREGRAPSKVLVGWGKGPLVADQKAPVSTRKSRWLPYFPSGEDGAALGQDPLLILAQASGQAPVQGQGQGQWPRPAQTTAASMSLPPPTTVPDMAPVSVMADPHPYTFDHSIDTIALSKNQSQDPQLQKCDNQWTALLESSKVGVSCQDKVCFQSQEELPSTNPLLIKTPDHAQKHKVTGKQVLPEQPDSLLEKPLVGPGNSTLGPESPQAPRPQKIHQEGSNSQPEQQPLNVCNNTYATVPPSAHQAACHREPPIQAPREALQIPTSNVPTCQLQEGLEDRVLVFDMATGNSRMGLLCHDPLGSRAVLVGVRPNHPSIGVPENLRSFVMPIHSPDSSRLGFWSTTPVLSSPVPSSLSSGSYREVALLPKEAKLNMELQNSPGTATPIRLGMFTGPIPLGMPMQFGERVLTQVTSPDWPKSDADKHETSHTIWVLDTSGMPEASMVQTKKLQWMNSEQIPQPTPPTNSRALSPTLSQEDTGHHKTEDVISVHSNDPPTEGAVKVPLTGQFPLAEQPPLAQKTLPAGQAPLIDQHPSTEQPPGQLFLHTPPTQPLTAKQPPLPGQLLLTQQGTPKGQPPFSRGPQDTKEPTPSKGFLITKEPGQASSLCQEGESVSLPAPVGVLRVPLAPEEACFCVSRGVSARATRVSSMPQLTWQHGSSPSGQEEHLSLITFSTPGTGYNVMPVAMVGTDSQNARLKMIADGITRSAVAARLGLVNGTCSELVSTGDALPSPSPGICRHSPGTYQDTAAVVIDTGTGFTKCGLAGEDHILSLVPSRVQRLQHPAQSQPRYVVSEDQEGSYPVLNRGVVSDWDALEVLWQHLFYCRLRMQPEELAVLVADSPVSPRTNREKVAEILFERFHVPAMQTVCQALLALYAYGRTSGLVLGSGYGTSYVTPILTGDMAPLDTYRLDIAGSDLTEYFAQLLLAVGHASPKTGLLNQMKEVSCYVAMDVAAEMNGPQAQAGVDFVLPDQRVITLGSERFRCPEALFQPNLLGLSQPGLPQLALLSISQLEAKQQEQLLANVVLDGGSTLLRGFPERLRQELGPRATVLASPHRALAAWLGGSMLASRDSFQNLWLSRREYEEEGPWAIYKYHL